MRLVSFKDSSGVRIGAVVDGKVVHLNVLLSAAERVPDDMTAFLTAGERALAAARKAVDAFKRGEGRDAAIALRTPTCRHRCRGRARSSWVAATISGTWTSCARRARAAAE